MKAVRDTPRVALLLNRGMAEAVLGAENLAILRAVAETSGTEGLPEELEAKRATELLEGADACMTCWGTPGLTAEMLAAAPTLRLVGHAAGSVKSLIPDAAWKRGVRVTSAAPIIAEDVAETVLGLMIVSLKRLWPMVDASRKGDWADEMIPPERCTRLHRITVGVVGASTVGRSLITCLAPFQVTILLYDPFVDEAGARKLGVTKTSLEELMKRSDVVTLHAPAVPETRHMINAKNLPLMRDGTLFMNTARGSLVDETALLAELTAGRLLACLDVTDPEPPHKGSPLYTLPNVILCPHVAGGHTANGRRQQGRFIVEQIRSFLTGGKLDFEITKEMLARSA
jgi:phosphoglycerate dehydrogenase-like enzyme